MPQDQDPRTVRSIEADDLGLHVGWVTVSELPHVSRNGSKNFPPKTGERTQVVENTRIELIPISPKVAKAVAGRWEEVRKPAWTHAELSAVVRELTLANPS